LSGSLGLPVHFGEPLADHWRFRIQRIGLFVRLDGFGGIVRAARSLILLLVNVSHRVVVIGVGARGFLFGGSWRGFSRAGGGIVCCGGVLAWVLRGGVSLRLRDAR